MQGLKQRHKDRYTSAPPGKGRGPVRENAGDRADRFLAQNLTWKSVRDAISPARLENRSALGLAYFFRQIALSAAIFGALLYFSEWYIALPLWLLAGFAISSLFIIGHDAAHGALFQNKTLAYAVGQIAMLPSLHAFHQWAYGHNRIHHGHTIKIEGDFVWRPLSPADYQALSPAQKLLHRLYWSPLGGGIYYMLEIWLKGMVLYTAPDAKAQRDKLLVIGFALATSAALLFFGGGASVSLQGVELGGFDWGAALWTWTRVGLIPFVVWNYFIGITVYVHHIHEEIPWKKHRDWSPAYGQLFGTVNYEIPWLANLFMLNIFVHMPHHVQPKIPFYNLPGALEDIKSVYGEHVVERRGVLRDYWRSARACKLFDPETGRWSGYPTTKAADLARAEYA